MIRRTHGRCTRRRDHHPLWPYADADFSVHSVRRGVDDESRAGLRDELGKAIDVRRCYRATQPVRAPHEGRNKMRLWPGIDLVRRAVLFYTAAVHHDNTIGKAHCLVLIVRDDNGCCPYRTQDLLEFGTQFLAHIGIERRKRLVKQHQLWFRGERDALLLSPAHLPGIAAFEAIELDKAQHGSNRDRQARSSASRDA